jgi:hypothetical protein
MSTILDKQESVLNFKDKTTTNYLDISLEKIMTYLKKQKYQIICQDRMILSGELSYLLPKKANWKNNTICYLSQNYTVKIFVEYM